MGPVTVIEKARRASRLSQTELAKRAGTSQPTVSAYEHRTKSPTLEVTERLVNAANHTLSVQPQVTFRQAPGTIKQGPFVVPDRLWRLEERRCFAVVLIHDIERGTRRRYDLTHRDQRRLLYQTLLRRGTPGQILRHVDSALLIDLWGDLDLPPRIRHEWQPLILNQLINPRVTTVVH